MFIGLETISICTQHFKLFKTKIRIRILDDFNGRESLDVTDVMMGRIYLENSRFTVAKVNTMHQENNFQKQNRYLIKMDG